MHPFTKDTDQRVKVATQSVDAMTHDLRIFGVVLLSVVSISVLLLGRISSGI